MYTVFSFLLLYTQCVYNQMGELSSTTTTSVQLPLGLCDSIHGTMVPVCSPHTSYR